MSVTADFDRMTARDSTCTGSRQEGTSSRSAFTSSQSKQETSLPEWRKRLYENAVASDDSARSLAEDGPEKCEGEGPVTKRSKCRFNYYVLASESDLPTDEDTESEHSIQGKETDFAKDTSDTSSSSDWSGSSSTLQFEYEIESSSEKSSVKSNSKSFSSGTGEDFVRHTSVLAAVIDDDLGLFADTSDSDSEPVFDTELTRTDYWTCVQCKNKNNNPMYRYCEKCFRLRKGFLPPRPRHRKSQKKKKSNPSSPPPFLPNLDMSADMESKLKKSTSELTTDSGYQCSEPASPQPSTSKEIPAVNDGPELCITCMSRPKNGIFVHSKIGHICCCYKCALRVWKVLGRCPLCHCPIRNVLQAFVG